MASEITTRMHNSLFGVFGEHDPARRQAAVAATYTEDVAFHDPEGDGDQAGGLGRQGAGAARLRTGLRLSASRRGTGTRRSRTAALGNAFPLGRVGYVEVETEHAAPCSTSATTVAAPSPEAAPVTMAEVSTIRIGLLSVKAPLVWRSYQCGCCCTGNGGPRDDGNR
jgi:hypothetical protein